MHSNLEELFSNDVVKEEVMDSEEGQTRLTAGKDDKWPVKEETSDTSMVKVEVEDEDMWRYGGCSTKKKPDFGKNKDPKRRKLTPTVEYNIYIIEKSLNAEVKEETAPFPAVTGYVRPPTQTGGSLPSSKLSSDNQVFNAHDLFTNEAIAKEELEEDEEEGDGMDQTADDNDSKKEDVMWKECPVYGCTEKSSSAEANMRGNMLKHMRMHPKPLLCGVCQKPWPTADKLRRHYWSHSEDKPFHCTYCTKKFSQVYHLKSHMRQHTQEHPYECDICGKKFKNLSSLTCHRRKHDKETLACTECSYRCASSGNLASHMLTHTEQASFRCSDCGRCFSRKELLEQHKEIHAGEKLSCPECDFKTACHWIFSSHMKNKHKK